MKTTDCVLTVKDCAFILAEYSAKIKENTTINAVPTIVDCSIKTMPNCGTFVVNNCK